MAKTTAIIMTLNIMVSVLSNGPMCSKALFIYIWPNVIVELSKVQPYTVDSRRPVYLGCLASCTLGDHSYIFFEWLQR